MRALVLAVTYARRTDANHRQIVEALRDCGWQVLDLHRAGNGVPDLIVWHYGRQALRLVEVKDGNGKLTEGQQRLIDEKWPISVIRTLEDATNL